MIFLASKVEKQPCEISKIGSSRRVADFLTTNARGSWMGSSMKVTIIGGLGAMTTSNTTAKASSE